MIKLVKEYYVTAVCILVAFLFVYAAMSKVLDFENFQVQLAQSPLLSAYAHYISFAVVITELTLALYLCLPTYQKLALYFSLGLMSAFTIYIFLILNYSDFVPCSCGGILEKLGWTEHLIFNIAFVLLISAAIFYKEKKDNPQKKLGLLLSLQLFSITLCCGAVVAMFVRSEHIMKKENNFTRRFLQHPIFDDKIYDLGVNSYYFAGIADGKIYLGNVTTPLFISQIDTGLQNLTRTKIALDHMDHPFRNVQIRVKSPYFYIYDGNVPVIYRGNLGNSTANTISYGDAFFNQLSVIDSMKFGIRTQKRDDNQYSIALLDLNRNPKLSLKPEVLQKQIDGVFDVDGVLTSDPENGKLVYTYFYRNQFIVMDTSLNVQSRLNTIDTTTRANLSVTKLSDGRNKMNAPSFSVNKSQTLFCGLIFNRSNLKGKHEPSSSWKNSSIIDVYSTDEQYYLGSFYIRHKDGNAMSSMISDGRYLYVLIGNELQRYRIRDGAFKFNIKRNQWFEEPLVDRDI
ncbi:MauE/DoxX family redox-associated membrane protein [Chryseobacterium gallinarum]|uniref:MauE/DoxX family redox-associated membrane protein n=1 Tax=Chryseobacterium gallinarum TaxID=1324352 RepID=UPI0006A712C5|nr:MauE/DoxX family redox-associated membrane protein [Chryseobacterium gallinarum]